MFNQSESISVFDDSDNKHSDRIEIGRIALAAKTSHKVPSCELPRVFLAHSPQMNLTANNYSHYSVLSACLLSATPIVQAD